MSPAPPHRRDNAELRRRVVSVPSDGLHPARIFIRDHKHLLPRRPEDRFRRRRLISASSAVKAGLQLSSPSSRRRVNLELRRSLTSL